jgi:hypothetical protein
MRAHNPSLVLITPPTQKIHSPIYAYWAYFHLPDNGLQALLSEAFCRLDECQIHPLQLKKVKRVADDLQTTPG